ncbi:MAG: mannitol dehydrogenase family protein [Oscillospiraceae bacterium]|jgi:fructuronate reductase|nr:mannitol dehydrogenase family protein [Oscillospiraceae bacterium]
MQLSLQGLQNRPAWQSAAITLPTYDIPAMRARTLLAPTWLHFGAGNLFRAFPCAALQALLNSGEYDRGVIACETYDGEIISRAYAPFDNLSLLAVLNTDGQIDKEVIASVADAIYADEAGIARMAALFAAPSLQMVSFTVTEKAYTPQNPLMALLAGLLLARYDACGAPLALLSMDNCAHNGQKLRAALLPAIEAMGDAAFASYVQDKISTPNSMIDKITPHPHPDVAAMLADLGLENSEIFRTDKGTVTAAFVNAERAAYLVIEDDFPNGRPPLERAGLIFTDRETVDKAEKMKVGTCLNPLHTALAVLGCLLNHKKISDEMADADLLAFVRKLGYVESLPVAENPGVLSPRAFLDDVIERRLPNPFLPDTPQRIATDTSQKLPVRFGWTLSHAENPAALTCVPFVFAAWLRYLTGVDDASCPFTPSPDPRMAEVQGRMAEGLTDALLSDASLFGGDLVALGLADKVRGYFSEMMQGKGAVRAALRKVGR